MKINKIDKSLLTFLPKKIALTYIFFVFGRMRNMKLQWRKKQQNLTIVWSMVKQIKRESQISLCFICIFKLYLLFSPCLESSNLLVFRGNKKCTRTKLPMFFLTKKISNCLSQYFSKNVSNCYYIITSPRIKKNWFKKKPHGEIINKITNSSKQILEHTIDATNIITIARTEITPHGEIILEINQEIYIQKSLPN